MAARWRGASTGPSLAPGNMSTNCKMVAVFYAHFRFTLDLFSAGGLIVKIPADVSDVDEELTPSRFVENSQFDMCCPINQQ